MWDLPQNHLYCPLVAIAKNHKQNHGIDLQAEKEAALSLSKGRSSGKESSSSLSQDYNPQPKAKFIAFT